MKLRETAVAGAFVVAPERIEDERGFFARVWDGGELSSLGLDGSLDQASISFNRSRGTLRGMHFQASPHEEAKVVRCTSGAVYDVVVDLRPDSSTYRRWAGAELTAENREALYVPKGCAHGFLSLADATEVLYLISQPYEPAAARGVRWDDPAFGIAWPFPPTVISERDAAYEDFTQ